MLFLLMDQLLFLLAKNAGVSSMGNAGVFFWMKYAASVGRCAGVFTGG